MADLMKIVREWEAARQKRTVRAEPAPARKTDLPWPGYNGGKQFVCDLCGVHFDTSAGIAKHSVEDCRESLR
jgi:hypothetical protein